jgi:hypothetical protein
MQLLALIFEPVFYLETCLCGVQKYRVNTLVLKGTVSLELVMTLTHRREEWPKLADAKWFEIFAGLHYDDYFLSLLKRSKDRGETKQKQGNPGPRVSPTRVVHL